MPVTRTPDETNIGDLDISILTKADLNKYTRTDLLYNIHQRQKIMKNIDKTKIYYKEELANLLKDHVGEGTKINQNADKKFYMTDQNFDRYCKMNGRYTLALDYDKDQNYDNQFGKTSVNSNNMGVNNNNNNNKLPMNLPISNRSNSGSLRSQPLNIPIHTINSQIPMYTNQHTTQNQNQMNYNIPQRQNWNVPNNQPLMNQMQNLNFQNNMQNCYQPMNQNQNIQQVDMNMLTNIIKDTVSNCVAQNLSNLNRKNSNGMLNNATNMGQNMSNNENLMVSNNDIDLDRYSSRSSERLLMTLHPYLTECYSTGILIPKALSLLKDMTLIKLIMKWLPANDKQNRQKNSPISCYC